MLNNSSQMLFQGGDESPNLHENNNNLHEDLSLIASSLVVRVLDNELWHKVFMGCYQFVRVQMFFLAAIISSYVPNTFSSILFLDLDCDVKGGIIKNSQSGVMRTPNLTAQAMYVRHKIVLYFSVSYRRVQNIS